MWPYCWGLKERNGFAHRRVFPELMKWEIAKWNKVTAQETSAKQLQQAPEDKGSHLSHANEWKRSRGGLPWWWAVMARDWRHMAKEEMQSYVSWQWFINNSTRSAKADWRHPGCYVIKPQRGWGIQHSNEHGLTRLLWWRGLGTCGSKGASCTA